MTIMKRNTHFSFFISIGLYPYYLDKNK